MRFQQGRIVGVSGLAEERPARLGGHRGKLCGHGFLPGGHLGGPCILLGRHLGEHSKKVGRKTRSRSRHRQSRFA